MDASAADAAAVHPPCGDADYDDDPIVRLLISELRKHVRNLRKRVRDYAPEGDDGEGAARGAPRRATTAAVVVAEQDAEAEDDDFLTLIGPATEDDDEQLASSQEEDFIPVDPDEDDDELASPEEDFIPIDLADDGMMGDSIIPQMGLTDDEDGQRQQLASGQEEDFIPLDPDEDDDHAVYGGHGDGVLLKEEDGQFASEEDEDLLSLDQIEGEDIVYDAAFYDRLVRPALGCWC